MRLSAHQSAHELAVRLDAVVPSPIRVFVEHTASSSRGEEVIIRVANGVELWSGQVISDIQFEPRGNESIPELAAGVAMSILNGAQDSVCRILRRPWPRLVTGEMALPGARADANRVHLWSGPVEEDAVLALSSIELG